VAEAGLPELAGQMMQFALAQPNEHWGDDTEKQVKLEPISQIERAIEFLNFQLLLPEEQIREAEEIATSIQEEVFTPIAFASALTSEDDGEPVSQFGSKVRKASWSNVRRNRIIFALKSVLHNISEQKEAS
jgi:hypothetical protein